MTSAACLNRMEVQAHSALATLGRIRVVLANAGFLLSGFVCLPYQSFRIWKKLHTLASLIRRREQLADRKASVSEAELDHAFKLLRELHSGTATLIGYARQHRSIALGMGPFLAPIERDTYILGQFLDDAEMLLSQRFQSSLESAIAELKPPTGSDWRASLEAMRH